MFAVTFAKTFQTGTLAGLTVRNQRMTFSTFERADAVARELDGVTLRECAGARDAFRVSDVQVVAV